MFNGLVQADDVQFYETTTADGIYQLTSDCKTNHLVYAAGNTSIDLPLVAPVGKIINIIRARGVTATGKSGANGSVTIKQSGSTIFNLGQGSVSLIYIGNRGVELSGITAAKTGWIVLGGAQGATSISSTVSSTVIGESANATGGYGATAIGYYAAASGVSSIATGYGATASNNYSIASGYGAAASGTYAIASGAYANASGYYATASGYLAAAVTSKLAYKANMYFATAGDAQAGKFILMRQTLDATALVMSATNAAASTTNILILPNNGTYAFKGIVVAKDAGTLDSVMWEVSALIRRGTDASTTTVVGTPTVTKLFNDTNAANWSITLTADTTNGGGTITVTGEASKTIRWVANIDSAEVM